MPNPYPNPRSSRYARGSKGAIGLSIEYAGLAFGSGMSRVSILQPTTLRAGLPSTVPKVSKLGPAPVMGNDLLRPEEEVARGGGQRRLKGVWFSLSGLHAAPDGWST